MCPFFQVVENLSTRPISMSQVLNKKIKRLNTMSLVERTPILQRPSRNPAPKMMENQPDSFTAKIGS
jgi:hypothetical protein